MAILFFLILFIGIPVAEIAVLIQVGGLIGVGWTIALILATAVIGTILIRHQGLQVLNQAQMSMQRQQAPLEPVIHGVFLLLAGALLLTPGFITDLIGFLCLIPPLRLMVAHLIWSRIQNISTFSAGSFSYSEFHRKRSDEPDNLSVIDGEYTSAGSDSDAEPDASSPWAKKD